MPRPLPTPSDSELAHSAQLQQLICNEIDANGPMTLARYMEMALYQPGLGYYRSGSQKFGVGGDFITAPELSSLFARCLAKRCCDVFDTVGQAIFEIGAGSGALACDMMREFESRGQLPECYVILELSAELAQRQRDLVQTQLPHLSDRFEWLQAWPEQPFNGVVIANELFDAMPVHRFIMKESLQECFVTHDNGQLRWQVSAPSTDRLGAQLNAYDMTFAAGYDSEINLLIYPWFEGLASAIGKAHFIFIDYGYKREALYHPERSMGTLMCHLQHQAHDDPLMYPGIQDITTHVDFTLLAEAAIKQGFDVIDLSTQAQFLMAQGVTELASGQQEIQQLKQLLLPGQMGESFKVLELCV
ncbi:MAG: SAM-dependent methyltransferase [Coxiella sp. (in: Bacteria)]|nr:MAG: SAM-dependent methyltransferase [Coxiella sp. (in: g-proteobacteria)]